MRAVRLAVRAPSVGNVPIDVCVAHEWTLRAVELADSGVWAEEACERCGDERVEIFANEG